MRLNAFQLKWIAAVTMVIDHIGAVLYPETEVFRQIGRAAFPIFCFLLVEGYFHTKNIRRYLLRLGICAIASEIPYDLAFRGEILEFGHQNVFLTLLLGMLMLYVAGRTEGSYFLFLLALGFMLAAELLQADYGAYGILLIFIYYLCHGRRWPGLALGAAWNFLFLSRIQRWGVLAAVPLALYNGERGREMKYFFYLFYPCHLLILYLAAGWL